MNSTTKFGIRVFATVVVALSLLLPLMTSTASIQWVQGYKPENAPAEYSTTMVDINVGTMLFRDLSFDNETSTFSLAPAVNLDRQSQTIMIYHAITYLLVLIGIGLMFLGSLLSYLEAERKWDIMALSGVLSSLLSIVLVGFLKKGFMQYMLDRGWTQAGDSVYTIVGVVDGGNTLAYTLQITFQYGFGVYVIVAGAVLQIIGMLLPTNPEENPQTTEN